jgi:hypothetical protein
MDFANLSPAGAEARDKLENELRERIMRIVQIVNEKQNHIPLKFQLPDLIPFPYEVLLNPAHTHWPGRDSLRGHQSPRVCVS